MCGGLGRNRMFLTTQANVVALPVITSAEDDPVLIGSAMLAAASAKHYPSLKDAVMAMAGKANIIRPSLDLHRYENKSAIRVFPNNLHI